MRNIDTLRPRYLIRSRIIVIVFAVSMVSVFTVLPTTTNTGCRDDQGSIQSASCAKLAASSTEDSEPAIPEPSGYKIDAAIPPVASPIGSYTGEFFSSSQPNKAVDPLSLPNRPFLGTELYWINTDRAGDTERDWLEELHLDFLRVEVDVHDVKTGADAVAVRCWI
jgi:hypothetical protein